MNMEVGVTMDSAAPALVVDPVVVGKAFVEQYYHILDKMPQLLHRFYKEISKVGRVGPDGVMHYFSTLQAISEELKMQSYGDFKSAKITTSDTQESHNGGILLVVTGYFPVNEGRKRKFTQTFFLAPQEKGYFVLNDILRFVNEPEATDRDVVLGNNSQSSAISAPTGKKDSELAGCVSVKPVCKEMSKPLNNEHAKENVLVPEIVNEEVPDIEITRKEAADVSLKSYDPDDGRENVPKKSYASVLNVAKRQYGVSASPLPSPKQISKDKEHQVSSDPSSEQILKDKGQQMSPDPSSEQILKDKGQQMSPDPSSEEILKDQGQQMSSDPSPVIESEAVSETFDAAESGHNQGYEVTVGTSIHVRHLPANATIDMLETVFKQFGAIGNGGIQVINPRGYTGFPYGFVEFEEADAAQRAIEASPVMIGGQRAFVEEKRSTGRGNRGSGNGYGNGNVGVRGRGSYGYGNNYRRGGGRSFNHRGNEYVAKNNIY